MRISLLVASIIGAVAVSGCGGSTGIVKVTDDTYMLAKQDAMAWSGSAVKVELYQEANAFCAKEGKKFVQVSNNSVDAAMYQTMAGAEIQFKCQ